MKLKSLVSLPLAIVLTVLGVISAPSTIIVVFMPLVSIIQSISDSGSIAGANISASPVTLILIVIASIVILSTVISIAGTRMKEEHKAVWVILLVVNLVFCVPSVLAGAFFASTMGPLFKDLASVPVSHSKTIKQMHPKPVCPSKSGHQKSK